MSIPTSTGRLTLGGKRRHGKGSKTKRAGLVFPVPRITKYLKKLHKGRTGLSSGIYTAAVVEYLTAEIAELASNLAKQEGRVRIIPKHIRQVIRNDDELRNFAGEVIVPQGGAQSFIHPALLRPKVVKRLETSESKALASVLTNPTTTATTFSVEKKHKQKQTTKAKKPTTSSTAFAAKRTVQDGGDAADT